MTRVAVTGAGGRMGRTVRRVAADREGVDAVAVARTPADVDGEAVAPADLPARLAEGDVDAVVDFTAPAAVPDYAAAAADAGVAFVTGTTGLDDAARAALDGASESVPVLHAPNFARGVAALRRAVREAVAALDGYDVELTDTHHRGKVDAPSGTAAALLEDVAAVRGDVSRVHGREGHQPRESGEVGVHSRRAGDVAGEHEVLIAGSDEALTLTHRTGGREVYAAGALDAAAWLAGRDAGRYDFAEVLDR